MIFISACLALKLKYAMHICYYAVYVIDGLQRLTTALMWLEDGADSYLGTTEEQER